MARSEISYVALAQQLDKKERPPRLSATGVERLSLKAKPVRRLAAGGFASNAMDVGAVDAEVVQFTSAHAAEFVNGLTILAPVVERAGQVHFSPFRGSVDRAVPGLVPSSI